MRVILPLALLWVITVPSAIASDGPKFSFDATYEVIGLIGRGTLRQASDGKGHMLHECTAFNGNVDITILDFINKKAMILIPRSKTAIPSEMLSKDQLVYDEQNAKKRGARSLGTKAIDGHRCHGWELVTPISATQTWIGDDTKYMVHWESKTKNVSMVMALKKWSQESPASSEFLIPSDYQIRPLAENTAKDSSAYEGMEIVTRCLKENKSEEAVAQLTKMLQKNPNEKVLLVTRGGVLFRNLKKPEEALKDFNKAIVVDPNWFQAYKRRGEYFAFLGNQEKAMADFNKCLSLAPDYGDAYVWRAATYAQQGKFKEALDDIGKAETSHARNTGMLEKVKAICQTELKKCAKP